jgi:beta-lactamase regulating signal transducer with metallopeptidase domain
MTTADLLLWLARANVAASAAVLIVLALRAPVRRTFGAHRAYALWLIAPVAMAGSFMPALDAPGWAGGVALADDAGRAWLAGTGCASYLAALWMAGVGANVALALLRQGRFAAAERAGRAGPAVVGVLQPRLVAPADFARRFTDDERRLVRAHELAHMDRHDGRLGALALAGAWVCWFNPLAHIALRAFRCDQELACDATVMERLPTARRAYAETMLRTEPLAREAVFGCHWLSLEHPLALRLDMLARRAPSQLRSDLGLAALALLCAISFGGTWASQPPSQRSDPASTVTLIELAPPDAQEAAWVYRWSPRPPRRR